MKIFIIFFFCFFFLTVNGQFDERYFAIQIDEAEGQDFDDAFQLGLDACMNGVDAFFTWKGLEPEPGQIGGEIFDLLDIVNYYYFTNDVAVEFQLALVNTVKREVPADLENMPFDDPVFVNRFKILLDSVFAHLPDVNIAVFNIGNEVDGLFGEDAGAWAEYKNFFEQVKPHAEQLYMTSHGVGLNTGVTIMFDGLTSPTVGPLAADLNEATDMVSLTYYPIMENGDVRPSVTVFQDFDAITSLYLDKPILFVECGYPSSPVLNSSEEKQRQFWENVFTAWDQHVDQIPWLLAFKLSDWSQEDVDVFAEYYGFPDNIKFKEFLRTLGLRTYPDSGENKLAYEQIKCEVKEREFCETECTLTATAEAIRSVPDIKISPNPFGETAVFYFDKKIKAEYGLRVFNSLGQQVRSMVFSGGEEMVLRRRGLRGGVYFYEIMEDGLWKWGGKIIIE